MTRARSPIGIAVPLLLALLAGTVGAAGASDVPPAPDAALTGGQVSEPRLMILAFAFELSGSVPIGPAFQGVLSREVPREIGRRIDALADLETRFYAVRREADGQQRFVVSQKMPTASEVILIGREGNAAFVLDGRVRVTDRLDCLVRLHDVKNGKSLWSRRYAAPTAKAAPLLEQIARDLLEALPGKLGARAASEPQPAHEPDWQALLAYMRAEDLRFSQQSGILGIDVGALFTRFLEAVRQDPAFVAPRAAVIEIALALIRQARTPLDVPLGALRRLAKLAPGAESYAGLARGLALADRSKEATKIWEKSVGADPAFVEGWLNVADGRVREGDFPGSAAALEKALEIGLPSRGTTARVSRDLGSVYLASSRIDDAIVALEASVRVNPDDPVTLTRLGTAYVRKGEMKPAEREIWSERALEAFRKADRLRGLKETPLQEPAKPTL